MNSRKTHILVGDDAIRYQLKKRFEQILKQKFKSDKEFLIKTKYNVRLFYRFKEPGNNPTFTTLYKMSSALGVTVAELTNITFKEKIEVKDYYMLTKTLKRKHKK